MLLDRLVINARPRTPWEAIDLGWLMARAWWRPLFIAWVVPSAVLQLLLLLLLPERAWSYILVIVWWLKPVWDCAPLYIASRALFDEKVKPVAAWRVVPGLLGRELLPWLTLRRFSVTRSADMPVTILEQLRGRDRAARLALLHRGIGDGATWLTIACANVETLLAFGLIGLLMWMVPQSIEINPIRTLQSAQANSLLTPALGLLSYIGMALMAPFYTMAGFALYISRRVELEGWDIEIRFRHLAARQASLKLAAAVVLAGMAALLCLPSSAAHAQEREETPVEAKQQIKAILADADFNQHASVWNWRFKDEPKPEQKPTPEWVIRLVEWIESHRGSRDLAVSAAGVVRFVLAVVLVSLCIYLLYRYREVLRGWVSRRVPVATAVVPEILFGLDVRPASLPSDVTAEVMALWREGRSRAALSLLYRATLSILLDRFALPFGNDHTEDECAAVVARSAQSQLAPLFSRLTRVWQQLAYAHREPGTDEIESLCIEWRRELGTVP